MDFLFFLSCLCGSEHSLSIRYLMPSFLSCLCGSERDQGRLPQIMTVSELPVRQ